MQKPHRQIRYAELEHIDRGDMASYYRAVFQDPKLLKKLHQRVRLPSEWIDGHRIIGLNDHFRFSKYIPGPVKYLNMSKSGPSSTRQALLRSVLRKKSQYKKNKMTTVYRVMDPGMGAFYPKNDAVFFNKKGDALTYAVRIWINGGGMGKPIVHLIEDAKQ